MSKKEYMVVTVKSVLKKMDQIFIQTCHDLLTFLAGIIGKHQCIDQHANAKAQRSIPNSFRTIRYRTQLRLCANSHQNQTGQHRRRFSVHQLIHSHDQNDTNGSRHKDKAPNRRGK